MISRVAATLIALCSVAAIVPALRAPEQKQCEIALLGDSIFSQLADRPVSPPFDKACNLGVSGAPMEKIAHLGQTAPKSARIVFLEGGINDILNDAPDQAIKVSYRKALTALADRRVYLVGVLPVDPSKMKSDFANYATRDRVERLNAGLAEICAAFSNCRLAIRTRDLPPEVYTTDGIHLSSAGHDTLVRRMAGDYWNN